MDHDELPWDLDVTVVRRPPSAAPARAAAPACGVRPPRGVRPARENRPAREPRRGRFHRPDLETPWQRLSRNLPARIAAGTLLVGGTALLVAIALTR